jgi:hypothetical protein
VAKRIVFYVSQKEREQKLAEAFLAGAAAHGFLTEKRQTSDSTNASDFDYACMVGVKSKTLWGKMKAQGVKPIMFDKGYVRSKYDGAWRYWRVSVGMHHPTVGALTREYPTDRFDALQLPIQRWRKEDRNKHVLYAGSSEKYHNFYGLPHPTDYARRIIKGIRGVCARRIVYRPKPSWSEAVPIRAASFSKNGESIGADLTRAHCLVTHGSNACFEAALMGIPSIILGQGVMKPISSTRLVDIEKPLMGDRYPILCALAYHQWTLDEMRSGEAFNTIKELL